VTRADSSRLSRRLLDPGLDSTTGYQQLCKISAGKYLLRVPVSMLEKCDDQQSQRGTGCSFPYSAHVAPFTYGPRCQSGQRFARIDLPRPPQLFQRSATWNRACEAIKSKQERTMHDAKYIYAMGKIRQATRFSFDTFLSLSIYRITFHLPLTLTLCPSLHREPR